MLGATELVESGAMSSELRKLLLEDGQEGGGASQRATARGQDSREEETAEAMAEI